jgi:YidC/Oxa1 family membrane protein insertase
MLIAAVATHFTSRAALARQSGTGQAGAQTVWMNRLMLWLLPLGVLVGGPFLPVAILLYWLSNNIWTLAQQHVVNRLLDREENSGASPGHPGRGTG